MKQNILDRHAALQIVTRVQLLQPTDEGRWGMMTVTEMLKHCNLANTQILEGERTQPKTTLKQYLLRILSLYIVPRFPKNMQGAPANDTSGTISDARFYNEREQFIKTIMRFPANRKPLTLSHIAFGNISTRQWGRAAWMHMDHHLRQFGV